MDITKMYPTAEQFEEFDASDQVNEWFEVFKKGFYSSREPDKSPIVLINSTLIMLESWRDNINPPQTTYYDDSINMHPFFNSGWKRAESNILLVTNNEYKFVKTIVDQIEDKYWNEDIPDKYFEKLSKVAMEEIVQGMANALYYYWLKDQLEISKNEPVPGSVNDPKYSHCWYGYAYAISVHLGLQPQPPINNKGQLIKTKLIEIGRGFGVGEEFYKGYKELIDSINNMSRFVSSIGETKPKDAIKWKEIIIDISKNNADVINWTKIQPECSEKIPSAKN